jgi:hypothetical protein
MSVSVLYKKRQRKSERHREKEEWTTGGSICYFSSHCITTSRAQFVVVFLIAMLSSLSRALKWYEQHVHGKKVLECFRKDSANIKTLPCQKRK